MSIVAIEGKGNAHQPTGEADQSRRGRQALGPFAFVERLPDTGLGSRHGGIEEQTTQFAWTPLGQTPCTAFLARVTRTRIQTREGHQGIRTGGRQTGKQIHQRRSGQQTNTGDRLHAVGFGLQARIRRYGLFERSIDRRDQLGERSEHGLRFGLQRGQMGQRLAQHPLCLDQRRSTLEQLVQVPLFARRWLPRMQVSMFVGDETGQQEGIDMIGLGSLTNGVGVVTDIFGVEYINREAGPVRQKRQTFVIASGRFQSDLCSRWQRLEPGFEAAGVFPIERDVLWPCAATTTAS